MKVKIELINNKIVYKTDLPKGVYLPLGDAYLAISNFGSTYFGLNYREFKIFDFNNIFPLKKVEVYENKLVVDNVSFEFKDNKMKINDFIPIFVDLRHLYDFNPFNRKYEYVEKEDYFVLKSLLGEIRFKGKFKKISEKDVKNFEYSFDGHYYWIKREYDFDKRRKDEKDWYVLYLFDFKGEIEFPFKFKDKKEELIKALSNLRDIYEKLDNSFLKVAFLILLRNLLDKKVGRPWFFQEWKRDYLVSLDAYYYFDKNFVKGLLINYFRRAVIANKRNNLHKEFHTDEFYLLLNRIVDFWHLFDENEKKEIIEGMKNFNFSVPIYNLKYDTWMDSIEREGINIEIQFYAQKVFEFFKDDIEEFNYLDKKMNKVIKEFIFHGFILDSLENFEIRPNFILAWYFNAKKFEEFLPYIKKDLNQLFLEWGGLTSLSFCYPLHYEEHTGIDAKSYHNGDSWYYINNMYADLLINNADKVDKELLRHALKIFNASLTDIYELFLIGGHSEISSAKKQESFGCFDQLWSNATLFKLLIDYSKKSTK